MPHWKKIELIVTLPAIYRISQLSCPAQRPGREEEEWGPAHPAPSAVQAESCDQNPKLKPWEPQEPMLEPDLLGEADALEGPSSRLGARKLALYLGLAGWSLA